MGSAAGFGKGAPERPGGWPAARGRDPRSAPASLIAAYGKSLFLALPIRPSWDTEDRAFLWIVCVPGTVVTIHETSVPALARIVQQWGDGMRFHRDTASAILYQILDHVIDEGMSFILKTRDAVGSLEERFHGDVIDEVAAESAALKRQLARLAAAFEARLYGASSWS